MRRPRVLLATRLARIGPLETPFDAIAAATRLAAEDLLDLPYPGHGDTWTRFEVLAEIAATDLSLAWIAMGHSDGHAILGQAGRAARRGMYGVWVGGGDVIAEPTPTGWRLCGTRHFAAGAPGLDRVLIGARAPDGVRLFDVALGDGIRPIGDGDVAIDLEVGADATVGAAGFYAERAARWRSLGIAACWYGGALGAYRLLRTLKIDADAVAIVIESMRAAIERAARDIDDGVANDHASARDVVASGCEHVLSRIPAVDDRRHARRAAELPAYLRQAVCA